jgi:hypothetical protein
LVSSVAAFRDYFDFGQSGSAYLAFDANVADAAAWVNRNASSAQVYMAPLWAVQGTMRVIGRNVPMKSFESRDTVVLPSNASGKDAFFVFPWEQEKKAQTLASRLGALGAREDLIGSAGFPVALAVRVPSQNLPDAQNPLAALAGGSDFIRPQQTAHAMWADSFELIGYSVQAADSEVTVLFHALRPVTQDYTFSLKARDAKGRVWGQEDKWMGDNSYATTQWSPGDLIIERFYPGLNACAPGGDYTVSIEAYDPRTMQGLALSDANGTTASLGTTHAEASPSNRLEDLEIEQPVQLQVAPQATLLGYTLDPQVRAGGSFSLALFWQGVGDGTQSRRFALRLVDAAKRNFALAEESVLLPPAGRGLCLFKDLTAPGDAADGPASILVNDVKIGAISIAK